MKGIEEALERIKISHYTAIAVMGCERDYETEEAIKIVEKALLKTQEQRIIVVYEKGFDGSWEKSEEGKKRLAEIKEWLKDKELGDYANPSSIINEIYLPKKYLKWEDLKFVYGEWNKLEVYLGNEKLGISYKSDFDFFDNSYEVVKIYNLKTKICICKIYDGDKQFFNNLMLERV